MRPTPIDDYAVIGDGRAAALVSRAGAIDWLCWPRFDSPSVFGALLDPRAGTFRIAPLGEARVRRAYLHDTAVLETRFETESGVLVLTDAMAIASEEDQRAELFPDHEIVRIAACERGEVEIAIELSPRPGYGARLPRFVDQKKLGLRIELGRGVLMLRTDAPLAIGDDAVARGRVKLRAGERFHVSLSYTQDGPAVLPTLGDATERTIARTAAWWRGWAARARYGGPWRDAVVRSAITVKLLQYTASGAIVAAPTMALPELLGGPLDWDYRYCWVRDASLTARALSGLGYRAEAELFVDWLVNATRLSHPKLAVLYDVFGLDPGRERVLPLAGYAGSRPVRLHNAADRQLQLDVYGEVIDAIARVAEPGARFDRDKERMLRGFGDFVCANWERPDRGLWESRLGGERHVHSMAMCWVALDRLVSLHRRGCIRSIDERRYLETGARIRATIDARGFDRARGSYVKTLDGDEVDAALLLLGWYGYDDPASARMRGTHARIRRELDAGDGLLRRYRGVMGEGAFAACGFWAVEHLARGGGSLDDARDLFERLVAKANDVGLFAEEIDPETGRALGNFPLAFTHVGVVNAAMSIEERERRARPRRSGPRFRPVDVAHPPEVRA